MPPCGGPIAITNKARGTVGNTAFMQLDLKETIWMLYCMCWKINPTIQKETRSTSWCHFNERQPCLVFHSVSVCWHVASTSTLVHMSAIHAVSNVVQLSSAQKRINDRLMKFKQLHPVNCATRSALFRKHTLDVFCHNYTVSVKLSCQLLQAISFLEHQKMRISWNQSLFCFGPIFYSNSYSLLTVFKYVTSCYSCRCRLCLWIRIELGVFFMPRTPN